MKNIFYKGWSSESARKAPLRRFLVTNIDVVKYDLLNHIWTIPGERMMHPNFGTRIPLLTFEPLDEQTIKIIEDDLRMVIDFDPRVELIDIAVVALPDNNTVACYLDLRYLELNATDTWKLELAFNR